MGALTPDTSAMVDQLLDYARSQGYQARVTSGHRTCEEQAALYAQGRTVGGRIVTGTSGCRSWHTWGRAVDLYIPGWPAEAYNDLGAFWQSVGGRWGGDFGDPGHFEWHPGVHINDVCSSGSNCTLSVQRGIPTTTIQAVATAALSAGAVIGTYYLWRSTRACVVGQAPG